MLRLALLLVLAAAALALAADASRHHPRSFRPQSLSEAESTHLPVRNERGHVVPHADGKRHHGWCGTSDDRVMVAPSSSSSASSSPEERAIPACSYYGDECDDPDVVADYVASYDQLPAVHLDARTYEFATDAGTNSLMTQADFADNTAYINEMYGAHNIYFNFTRVLVNSTTYQQRVVLPFCDPSWLDDEEVIAEECFAEVTGYSGYPVCWSASTGTAGCSASCKLPNMAATCTCLCLDTDKIGVCTPADRADSTCQPECNFVFSDNNQAWDKGQCCPGGGGLTCRDPQYSSGPISSRGWINEAELKARAQQPPYDSHLALYLLNLAPEAGLLGISTFPMDPTAFQNGGGVMLNAAIGAWGDRTPGYSGGTAVHEMGHSLGLYHTHAGVSDLFTSKTAYCSSDCAERQPSNANALSVSTVGDLCADTRPTPVNYECEEPSCTNMPGDPFCNTCSRGDWVNTPYKNFMGYAPDSCYDAFSTQQMARARCIIDAFLLPTWGVDGSPAVRLPGLVDRIRVASSSSSRIRITWSTPVWPGTAGMAGITGYRVSRTPAFTSGPATVEVTQREFTDSDVVKGASYVYSVLAVNAQGAGPALSKTAVAEKSAASAAAAVGSLLAVACGAVAALV